MCSPGNIGRDYVQRLLDDERMAQEASDRTMAEEVAREIPEEAANGKPRNLLSVPLIVIWKDASNVQVL